MMYWWTHSWLSDEKTWEDYRAQLEENPFDAGIRRELQDEHIPAHFCAALALFVEEAAAALYPPGFEFGDNLDKSLLSSGNVGASRGKHVIMKAGSIRRCGKER